MKNCKLTALALAALSLSALAQGQAQPTSSVQLYGQLTAGVTALNHQGAGNGSTLHYVGNNEFAVSLIGFSGTEDLGGGMKALFRLESGLNSDTGTQFSAQKFFNRQSYVGMNFGDYGTVTLGRQFSAGVDRAIRTLDIYNLAGQALRTGPTGLFGVNKYATAAANGAAAAKYIGFDSRVDSSIKYRVNVPSAGMQLGASFGFDDGEGRNYSIDAVQGNKDYQIGALLIRYEAPFQIGGATPVQDTYMFGGNFAVGPTRIYFSYLNNKADTASAAQVGAPRQEDKLWHAGLRWTVQPNVVLTAAYYLDQGHAINNVAGRDGSKTTWVASADYLFSKRTTVNLGVFSNQLKDGYRLDPVNGASLAGHAASAATPTTGSAIVGVTAGVIHYF